jgi:hypothetical protein
MMQLDINGRLRNIHLSTDKVLMPLFEAVINSIHAIQDLGESNGLIDVYIDRENFQTGLIDNGELAAINGFTVTDNGIGFDEKNFLSFKTSDSIYKIERGSKGIGRFIWLKVFKSVSISSLFIQGSELKERKFEFAPSGEGISKHKLVPATASEVKTTVSLKSFNGKFKSKCPQKIEVISKRIIEHCIAYFMLDSYPTIIVHDGINHVNLKQYFETHVKDGFSESAFQIKEYDFVLKTLMFYDSQGTDHTINYCANNREVKKEKLSKYISDLPAEKKIRDVDGQSFMYFAYLTSNYLDERVNGERTEFNIINDSKEHSLDLEEVYFDQIRNQSLTIINQQLSPYLKELRDSKEEKIKRYINTTAPHYKPLLKYASNLLEKIPSNLTDEKLDIELHRNMLEYEITLKEEGQKVLSSLDRNFSNYPEYKEKYYQFLEQYNDLGAANLAKYIVHRKIILEIFEKNLQKNSDGSYRLEKDVHQIIFPLNSTSNSTQFEMHNLWLIDERLSYHQYLASDQPLKRLENLSINSRERPDIIVFNNPVAFVEGEVQPYSSIVILEFKRPMRGSYSAGENPITQVLDYIRKIRSGSFTDKNGRLVAIPETIPFYGYIICDLTPDIKDFAMNAGYTVTPDLQGYFGYNTNFNAYMEIMSFEKLLGDAKKRNQVLFRKLNLI